MNHKALYVSLRSLILMLYSIINNTNYIISIYCTSLLEDLNF